MSAWSGCVVAALVAPVERDEEASVARLPMIDEEAGRRDHRRERALHVGGSATHDLVALAARRVMGHVDGVEMPVPLEGGARPAAELGDDARAAGELLVEPHGGIGAGAGERAAERVGRAFGHRPLVAGWARRADEVQGERRDRLGVDRPAGRQERVVHACPRPSFRSHSGTSMMCCRTRSAASSGSPARMAATSSACEAMLPLRKYSAARPGRSSAW